jgi:hypothetical protein
MVNERKVDVRDELLQRISDASMLVNDTAFLHKVVERVSLLYIQDGGGHFENSLN